MIPLDVATLVDEYNVGPLSLLRSGAPVLNAYGGHDVPSPTTISLTPVAIYTPKGRELHAVPEADRHRETIAIATRVAIRTAGDGQSADRLTYRGRNWRVVNVQDYELQGGVWLGLAVLEDEVPS